MDVVEDKLAVQLVVASTDSIIILAAVVVFNDEDFWNCFCCC